MFPPVGTAASYFLPFLFIKDIWSICLGSQERFSFFVYVSLGSSLRIDFGKEKKNDEKEEERGGGDARSNGTLIDSRIRRLIIYVCNFDAFSLACFENDVYFIEIYRFECWTFCTFIKKWGKNIYIFLIRKFNKTILMNLIKFPVYFSIRETWRISNTFKIWKIRILNLFFFSIKPIRERRKISQNFPPR